MARKKVMLVVGARPQFVKAAALLSVPAGDGEWLLVHTGQHYDYEMSAAFFGELNIPPPKYNLGVGPAGPGAQLTQMIEGLTAVIGREEPAVVVVVGDTTSTLAGALAASFAQVPVAHVEAGMRSADWRMPEERARVITDRLAALRLCPHEDAAANLEREGIRTGVEVVGDLVYEVAAAAYPKLDEGGFLGPLGLEAGRFFYVTCHRAENADSPARLRSLCAALAALSLPVYFPVHPRTAKTLAAEGLWENLARAPHVRLAPPTNYFTSLALVKFAAAVITDSGGVQREAFLYDTPTVTLRDRTEWPETVAAGVNVLADMDEEKIVRAAEVAQSRSGRRPRFAELVREPPPSGRIAGAIARLLAGV